MRQSQKAANLSKRRGIDMKYVSDVTGKVYNTVDALEQDEKKVAEEKAAAEKALAEKKANREARAKEVDEALKAAVEAQKTASEKLAAFCKDYGVFHTSIENADVILGNQSPFDRFFRSVWGF